MQVSMKRKEKTRDSDELMEHMDPALCSCGRVTDSQCVMLILIILILLYYHL